MAKIFIRDLTESDIPGILAIDRKITGKNNSDYWQEKAIGYLRRGGSACLVAEVNGQLAGFILGEIRGWEFGVHLTGWLEIVGVDPSYHRKGVGRELVESLCQRFVEAGVDTVRIMVDWNAGDLVSYFMSSGFHRSEYIILERRLGRERR